MPGTSLLDGLSLMPVDNAARRTIFVRRPFANVYPLRGMARANGPTA